MKFDTRAIHAGGPAKKPYNSLSSPICMSSTFSFDSLQKVQEVMSFASDDYVYTRGNNPTLRELEEKMQNLEKGNGAVAFASGMAAISSVLLSLLKPGDLALAHRTLYGSSHSVLHKLLPRYGINAKALNLTNLEELEKFLSKKNCRLIYLETPANPNLEIIDIAAVCRLAKKYQAKVVVDNTFATPYLCNPLSLGADVVVHSATKYLCGHGDALGGVAVAQDEQYIAQLKFDYMCELGGAMSPFNAWLILRGIKTLGLRLRAHCQSALQVAKFLQTQDKVKKVIYPGLPECAGHQIAQKQMQGGFGAMVSLEMKGGLPAAQKLTENLNLFKLAVSLGDCESLIEVPAAMTHFCYPQDKLAEFGLSPSLVRLSIGLEDSQDLIQALEQALKEV